jgi:hypothetical protein
LLIIFCDDPLRPGQLDQAFEAETEAARTLGIDRGLIGYEALVNERRPARAVGRIAAAEPPRHAIYRGWMLRPSEYAVLYEALMAKGIRLLNSPAAYRHCHYLPESYPVIAGRTARSVWLPLSDGFSIDAAMRLLQAFGSGPVIVKDYVKSQKHDWHEACFIPSAADARMVERVVRRFLELQGDSLNEGLVSREFVEFEPLAEHSRSGMPMTREFRMFALDGEVLCCAPYWDEGVYEGAVPSAGEFSGVMRRVQSRFFSMDVARRRGGDWMIVELGDGQVAGLPPGVNAVEFYRMLMAGGPAQTVASSVGRYSTLTPKGLSLISLSHCKGAVHDSDPRIQDAPRAWRRRDQR